MTHNRCIFSRIWELGVWIWVFGKRGTVNGKRFVQRTMNIFFDRAATHCGSKHNIETRFVASFFNLHYREKIM